MVNVLLSESCLDEKWVYLNLKRYISQKDQVCILPFAFYSDTKTIEDWNKQYAYGQGIWYKGYEMSFTKYGVKKDHIVWVNYFTDSIEEMRFKIDNSTILFLPGGAPDLMMKRIKEKKLKKVLKNYDGLVIGYSAGAMIQLKRYHITPDEDYANFSYQTGLGYLDGFDIECHFRKSKIQMESIQKIQQESAVSMYGIYEKGGILIDQDIICFGNVEKFAQIS